MAVEMDPSTHPSTAAFVLTMAWSPRHLKLAADVTQMGRSWLPAACHERVTIQRLVLWDNSAIFGES